MNLKISSKLQSQRWIQSKKERHTSKKKGEKSENFKVVNQNLQGN